MMLGIIALIILVFAFVLACLAAYRVPEPPTRPSFGWLAIALVILWVILTTVPQVLH